MSVRTVPGALDILNQKLGGTAGDIPASSTKEYALEKIYRTLGGEESLEGVNTTSEIIEKIAGVAQGGGGSSDFSTAEVTFINNTSENIQANSHETIVIDSFLGGMTAEQIGIRANASITRTVVLYKGVTHVEFPIIPTITGNATMEVDGDAALITITGDCTITFSDTPK